MQVNWREALEFESDLNLSPLLKRLYAARGVKNAADLDLTLSRLLSFHNLLDIDKATSLLLKAISKQKHILIVADFDADGATACALAILGLQMLGAKNVSYLVPNRFEFGYGLTPEIVQVALTQKPDLLLTVDSGITSFAGVKAAKKAGLSVIITDHHLAADKLPDADAIVNPNQPNCTFASKNLAGVGVMFYVLLALRAALIKDGKFTPPNVPNLASLLDLVALGTVADVVPLDFNNRILVAQGLSRIRANNCRSGINALIGASKLENSQINASNLAFALAPRLNAAGRIDDMSIGIECLLTTDAFKAQNLAAKLSTLNNERKNIESTMQIEANIEMSKLDLRNLPAAICLYQEHWHQGVIGILASRLKEQYQKPAIIFAASSSNEIKGSARSVPDLHIKDCLTAIAAQNPNLILHFGGHAMAAGLTLKKENFADFAQAFAAKVKQMLPSNKDDLPLCDQIAFDEITLQNARQIHFGGPWGANFAEPLFYGKFKVMQQYLLAGKHLKLQLVTPNGALLNARANG